MTDKTKKIIAREGLVIVGVILLSCVVFLSNLIYKKLVIVPMISYKVENLDNGKRLFKFVDGTELTLGAGGEPSLREIESAYVVMTSASPSASPHWNSEQAKKAGWAKKDIEILERRRFLETLGNILWVSGFYIILFGYPVCIFTRFIIWAVKMLRKYKKG